MNNSEAAPQLEKLVNALRTFNGPWGEWKGGEKTESGAIQMPYVVEAQIVQEAKVFLYENELMVDFDWASWQEGRDIFKSEDPKKFDNLDQDTVLKLLTAVSRNSRFNEGAWMAIFESGEGQKLFMRLLELQN